MKNQYPTAVYLQDGNDFRLVMVRTTTQTVIVKKPGQNINRVLDEMGLTAERCHPKFRQVAVPGDKPAVRALQNVVKGVTEAEMSEMLFSVLTLNFALLDPAQPHKLFSPLDRTSLISLGFSMLYTESEGIVTEQAVYTVETVKGWADLLQVAASALGVGSTVEVIGWGNPLLPPLYQPANWMASVDSYEKGRQIHGIAHKLKALENIRIVCLHVGDDRSGRGAPLMAFVPLEGSTLTCFHDHLDPETVGANILELDGKVRFIRFQRPYNGSPRRVGSFTIVGEPEIRQLLGIE